jgi:hypothetical protein
LGGEAEVGVDDGEGAGFGELGQETGGDYMDAGEGQGGAGESSLDWGSGEWRVASGEWGPGASVGGEERFLVSLEMTVGWGLEMTVLGGGMAAVGGRGRRVSLLLMRRPESCS